MADMPGPVTDPRAGSLLEQYRRTYGGRDLPVPVESIAEDLLGLIVVEDEDLECSGMLIPSRREIRLNAAESREFAGRRRFTLAHEIGHWICQVQEGRGQPVMCRAVDISPTADRALEREANVFAAELLMPEPAVRVASTGDPDACAARFGVSPLAMRWRLYSFGLLSESPS
jgi:Zn-dependent peptidase ImmA (M78 family)